MKAAPLQLLQVLFRKVVVELDEKHAPAEPPNPFASVFVFDGIEVRTEFGIGEVGSTPEGGKLFSLSLRVMVDNQPQQAAPNRKYSPYLIDVDVRGMVMVPKGAEKPDFAEDLAAVNGASLLWSSVREQVAALTSRMVAGPVTLPTMNFHDLKKGPLADENADPAASIRRGRKGSQVRAKG